MDTHSRERAGTDYRLLEDIQYREGEISGPASSAMNTVDNSDIALGLVPRFDPPPPKPCVAEHVTSTPT